MDVVRGKKKGGIFIRSALGKKLIEKKRNHHENLKQMRTFPLILLVKSLDQTPHERETCSDSH